MLESRILAHALFALVCFSFYKLFYTTLSQSGALQCFEIITSKIVSTHLYNTCLVNTGIDKGTSITLL